MHAEQALSYLSYASLVSSCFNTGLTSIPVQSLAFDLPALASEGLSLQLRTALPGSSHLLCILECGHVGLSQKLSEVLAVT